jgi:hypothetical protein
VVPGSNSPIKIRRFKDEEVDSFFKTHVKSMHNKIHASRAQSFKDDKNRSIERDANQ